MRQKPREDPADSTVSHFWFRNQGFTTENNPIRQGEAEQQRSHTYNRLSSKNVSEWMDCLFKECESKSSER